ncbi:MAG: type II toxin-antitoxin system VapC family toxin [Desulfobacterales bacterium]|nr:type II toxin-antitoxin system VapC family toxin [Desulfobacterales bacterium]
MKYLLDTCVISEVIKPSPNEQVVKWIADRDKETLFLSVLTIGELHKGINKLPESEKKTDIQLWMKYDLYKRFGKRILGITEEIAIIWGKIQATSEKQGRKMPAIDSLLAATGIFHKLILVTRNTSDFEACEVSLFNPWDGDE